MLVAGDNKGRTTTKMPKREYSVLGYVNRLSGPGVSDDEGLVGDRVPKSSINLTPPLFYRLVYTTLSNLLYFLTHYHHLLTYPP